jgi:uncharacterized protein YqgQ
MPKVYRIGVTYDNLAMGAHGRGLRTSYVRRVRNCNQADCGDPFPPNEIDLTRQKWIVRWEDSQYSFNLFQSPLSNAFELGMFSKRLYGQAEAAIAQTVKLEQQEFRPKEVARAKANG